ncbi:hypothetical protein G7Z17_g282 [Cylindrodendrum hubeiense]|uniref:Nephrocystin 3-like N-terminal domain-containing protein n=1 Tax=Cylindrodendrum hubeiense TaxID=595255 RepID=A0A9P5HI56_9HYPO|nr:hypothetical protein G7Z17_g282 [Cylindrodendrum hubeiense]
MHNPTSPSPSRSVRSRGAPAILTRHYSVSSTSMAYFTTDSRSPRPEGGTFDLSYVHPCEEYGESTDLELPVPTSNFQPGFVSDPNQHYASWEGHPEHFEYDTDHHFERHGDFIIPSEPDREFGHGPDDDIRHAAMLPLQHNRLHGLAAQERHSPSPTGFERVVPHALMSPSRKDDRKTPIPSLLTDGPILRPNMSSSTLQHSHHRHRGRSPPAQALQRLNIAQNLTTRIIGGIKATTPRQEPFLPAQNARSWLYDSTLPVFACYGPPGVGKSMLVSKAIDVLQQIEKWHAYFYLGHGKVQTAAGVTLALLEQLYVLAEDMPPSPDASSYPQRPKSVIPQSSQPRHGCPTIRPSPRRSDSSASLSSHAESSYSTGGTRMSSPRPRRLSISHEKAVALPSISNQVGSGTIASVGSSAMKSLTTIDSTQYGLSRRLSNNRNIPDAQNSEFSGGMPRVKEIPKLNSNRQRHSNSVMSHGPPTLTQFISTRIRSQKPPSEEVLLDLLYKTLQKLNNQVVIILDGWDEDNMVDPLMFGVLLETLLSSQCKIFITSRSVKEFRSRHLASQIDLFEDPKHRGRWSDVQIAKIIADISYGHFTTARIYTLKLLAHQHMITQSPRIIRHWLQTQEVIFKDYLTQLQNDPDPVAAASVVLMIWLQQSGDHRLSTEYIDQFQSILDLVTEPGTPNVNYYEVLKRCEPFVAIDHGTQLLYFSSPYVATLVRHEYDETEQSIDIQLAVSKACLEYLERPEFNSDAVRIILRDDEIGALDKWNKSPLYYAWKNDHADALVQLFEAQRTDLWPTEDHAPGGVSLEDAVAAYSMAKSDSLARTEAEVKGIALMQSIRNNLPNVAELLMRLDPNPNFVFEGTSLLYAAVEKKQQRIATQLVSAGADPSNTSNEYDGNREPILHLVVRMSQRKTLSALLESGRLDINCVDGAQRTALFTALEYLSEKEVSRIAKRLMSHGLDVDKVGQDGSHVLHIAAKKGFASIISDIIFCSQLTKAPRDADGHTPAEYASRCDHHQAALMLQAAYGE